MKTNKLVLLACLGLVAGSLSYIANFQSPRELHAGIGGTWSADMKTRVSAFRDSQREEYLVALIQSGHLSDQQRIALQSQYLADAILKRSAAYGSVSQSAIEEAVDEAIRQGVLSSEVGR